MTLSYEARNPSRLHFSEYFRTKFRKAEIVEGKLVRVGAQLKFGRNFQEGKSGRSSLRFNEQIRVGRLLMLWNYLEV
jgi:hypothetical protein